MPTLAKTTPNNNDSARLRQIDPTPRASDIRKRLFRRPEGLARYEEGLRKAGLPGVTDN